MIFKRRDIEQYTDSLAAYLPGGELFTSKSIQDSNFRKLLRGMAGELFTANGLLIEYDILPDATNNFLSEWESTLGIPDDCFTVAESNDDRRRNILTKLAALGVQTAEDFEAIGDIFGVTVNVTAGVDEITFPLTFPVFMFATNTEARFTIMVRFTVQSANKFTLTFPITFGSSTIATLECLFEKLKPANCNLIFEQV